MVQNMFFFLLQKTFNQNITYSTSLFLKNTNISQPQKYQNKSLDQCCAAEPLPRQGQVLDGGLTVELWLFNECICPLIGSLTGVLPWFT